MNELQLFQNKDFGEIRTLEEDGKVLFCGLDMTNALKYTNSSKALGDHCKGVTKRYVPTKGGMQEMSFIPESDVYRLIIHSRLPAAEQFEHWVFDEVLPSVQHTGTYNVKPAIVESVPYPRASMGEVANFIQSMRLLMEKERIPPNVIALTIAKMSRAWGVEFPTEFVGATAWLPATYTQIQFDNH